MPHPPHPRFNDVQMPVRPQELEASIAVKEQETVYLNVYDLAQEVVRSNYVFADLLNIGGAFHVGVEVYQKEWCYDKGGVWCTSKVRKHRQYSFHQSVDMGGTTMSKREVNDLLATMKCDWRGVDYDWIRHNCCCFADELCFRLVGKRNPAWVDRAAKVIASSPMLEASLRNYVKAASGEGQVRRCPSAIRRGVAFEPAPCSPRPSLNPKFRPATQQEFAFVFDTPEDGMPQMPPLRQEIALEEERGKARTVSQGDEPCDDPMDVEEEGYPLDNCCVPMERTLARNRTWSTEGDFLNHERDPESPDIIIKL
eukprot:gnl/TRDRNA2_/TRDRNA2_173604_c0_seq2.p2 gnl/TRDRNA2_/TRDRNA2_173604_c0~~gnl/TRDRNA2_/TRDRNA2_173604_c0_seq2.p2  ORF type:complete len:311 (-),score=50.89 gnl/TRDRNA2_/TRDRNA2_173604_c0_seq2:1415-2347(-)